MSMDSVDDIQAAEETAEELAASVAELLRLIGGVNLMTGEERRTIIAVAEGRLASWRGYCRPTCQAYGDPAACEDDDPDCCGCPCDHGEPAVEAEGVAT